MGERRRGFQAVVTGGGAGIGLATAERLGREGAFVALLERDPERAAAAAAHLAQEGIRAFALTVDVAEATGVAAAFAEIERRFGGAIDLLVNNAGIVEFATVAESSLESFQRILAVNVTGTFLCSKAALPMLERARGAIVNLASIAGLVGFPRLAAYCAAKAAVIGLTRQMAVDYAAVGVRVNCVAPGRIAGTELDRWIVAQDSEMAQRAKLAKYPLGRFGTAEEVAAAIGFLGGPTASFVTGAVLTVDGGMTAA